MSEKSITLLELHLGDGDINVGPFGVTGRLDETEETPEVGGENDGNGVEAAEESGGCPAKSIGGLLLLIGVLAAVGVGVAKLLGGDDDVDLGS